MFERMIRRLRAAVKAEPERPKLPALRAVARRLNDGQPLQFAEEEQP